MKATIDKAGALHWRPRTVAELRHTHRSHIGQRVQRGRIDGTVTRIIGERLVDQGRVRTFEINVTWDHPDRGHVTETLTVWNVIEATGLEYNGEHLDRKARFNPTQVAEVRP